MSSSTIWSAGRYEAVADQIAPIAGRVVDAANARSAVRDAALVDLACGTGSAALAAAALGARVTAVDITPELVAIATEKARAAGRGVDFVVADASATGLPAQSFDVAVSNMGTIFVEPVAQVAEFERLLKSGGTLAFSSWVPDPENPFFSPIAEVLGPPPPSAYTPSQWGEEDTITARLSGGFCDVAVERGVLPWQFPSVQAAVNFVAQESPMHVTTLNNVEPAQREPLLAAFDAAMRARSDGSRVRFDAPYIVVTARRR
jgi:SAM-dependent methyltransferase